MNSLRNKLVALIFAFAFATAPVHSQTVYNVVTDFSSVTNSSSSTWSYRYQLGTVRDGNYALIPNYGPAVGVWTPTNPGAWTVGGANSQVGVNRTGFDATYSPNPFIWPNNTMLMHPNTANLVVVSWLAQASGPVDIAFSFGDLDGNSGDGVLWFVERNNSSSTLISGTLPNGGSTGPLNLSNVSVGAGDRINFIVDPNANENYDSTQLTAVIVQVPEPSSLILCGIAAGLIRKTRRRQAPKNA